MYSTHGISMNGLRRSKELEQMPSLQLHFNIPTIRPMQMDSDPLQQFFSRSFLKRMGSLVRRVQCVLAGTLAPMECL